MEVNKPFVHINSGPYTPSCVYREKKTSYVTCCNESYVDMWKYDVFAGTTLLIEIHM